MASKTPHPPVASAAILSKTVDLLLLIYCLLLLPLLWGFIWRFSLCFATICILNSFAIISLGKGKLVALRLLCSEYTWSVAVIMFCRCHVGA